MKKYLQEKILKQWLVPFLIALVIAFLIKTVFFQSYIYRTNSLNTELEKGDFVYLGTKNKIKSNDIILFKTPDYINELNFKRCVAVAGDTIYIKNSELFVNNVKGKKTNNIYSNYRIIAFDSTVNDAIINYYKLASLKSNIGTYDVSINLKTYNKILQDSIIKIIEPVSEKRGYWNKQIFPKLKIFRWNKDNFGPLIVPKKGMKLRINEKTFVLYKHVIENHENNKIEIRENQYFLNGEKLDIYSFKQDYYFVLNDNRKDINDSRSWGFVPAKNIKGKKLFVWLNL